MCHGRVTLPRSVQITADCSICQLSVAAWLASYATM